MISHICGKLACKKDFSVVLDVGGIFYEIFLPGAVMKNIEEKIDKDNMLGPAPCPITRIGGYFRWNILVKEKTRSIMVEKLREALDGFRVPNTCFLAIDIDTMGM